MGPHHHQPEMVCSASIVSLVKIRPKHHNPSEQFFLAFQQLPDRQLTISILQAKGGAFLKDARMQSLHPLSPNPSTPYCLTEVTQSASTAINISLQDGHDARKKMERD